MDELLAQFLIEGRDLVAQASGDLALLQRDSANAEAIDSAFRAIHTLKGSVAIFAMTPAERVLHAAEDLLSAARGGKAKLDAQAVAALTACIDATDRWIDEIEQGALGSDADSRAAEIIARIAGSDPAPAADAGAAPEWLAPLIAREAATVQAASGPLTAFRYTPDAECFFRGDDPLAMVAAVPALERIAILPLSGEWPDIDAVEPFQCIARIEGLSSAPVDQVRAAFRMVPDQVAFHTIAPTALSAEMPSETRSATLRVDAARVDALADGLGELIVAVNRFAPLAERAEASDRALAAEIRAVQADIERVAGDLHRSVSAVRLVPLAPVLRRLPRIAREIAGGLGKPIAFTVEGDTLEVDKHIADGLYEPLLHLIRNAIDHGIEGAEARAEAAKSAEGSVHLSARRDGNEIVVVLSDDGGGIDADRIRAAAIERGLIGAEAAAMLDDARAMRLIFAPGFSTAEQVTGVSGRGVGMDAVLSAVERMRGTIEIDSTPGKGTRFVLRLPAHALTTRLLIVETGGERYGVALDQIVETVRIDNSQLQPVGAGMACVLRGRTVPVLSLAALLGAADTPSATAKLLVTRSGGARVALRVDGFAERIDTLVRPPSGLLAAVPGVTGSALMGDGGVLLVLDLPELAA